MLPVSHISFSSISPYAPNIPACSKLTTISNISADLTSGGKFLGKQNNACYKYNDHETASDDPAWRRVSDARIVFASVAGIARCVSWSVASDHAGRYCHQMRINLCVKHVNVHRNDV